MLDLLSAIFSNPSVATVFLLIVAALGYFVIESIVDWRRVTRRNRRRIDYHLRVVIRSASKLLHELRKHLVIPEHKNNPNNAESLCYRLVHFLTAVRSFSKHTYCLDRTGRLESAEYFLNNKIPLILRGNLYKDAKLSTEIQELLASAFTSNDGIESLFDFNIQVFRQHRVRADLDDACKNVLKFLDFGAIDIDSDIDTTSNDWRDYTSLCHLFIYVADFCMNFEHLPTWEEYRVYCASVVHAFGTHGGRAKPLHLYEHDDLSSTYDATYSSQGYTRLAIVNHFGLSRLIRNRGVIQSERHGMKTITKEGLVWTGAVVKKDKITLNYPKERSHIRRVLANRIHNI